MPQPASKTDIAATTTATSPSRRNRFTYRLRRPRAKVSRVGRQALAPAARPRAQLVGIDTDQCPIFHFAHPGDPDVAHLLTAGRVDELRERMIDGLRFERVQAHGDEVGLLAGDDRADALAQAERPSAVERRRLKRVRRIERARIRGDAL